MRETSPEEEVPQTTASSPERGLACEDEATPPRGVRRGGEQICTDVQLFVLRCTTTWRQPGISFCNQSHKSFFFKDRQSYRQTRLGIDASSRSIKMSMRNTYDELQVTSLNKLAFTLP